MIRVKIKDFKLNFADRAGVAAKLPCSLSTALSSGDSPELHSNDAVYAEFAGVVEIEPALLSAKHVCLRLSGISEPAEVVLNGKTISSPDSRERIYIYNVKDRLFPGYNTLVIKFSRDRRDALSSGIRLRAGEPYDPAIESVELLAFDSAAINSVGVTQTHTSEGVTLNVNMGIIGNKENVRAVATAVSPSGKIYYGGLVDGRGSITVSDPLLWWPLGMGVQNLYDLNVNLYYGDQAEDIYEMKVGLRTLETTLVGGDPAVSVNGVHAFLKGARLMPETANSSFGDAASATLLIRSAADCGINTLYASPSDRAPSTELLDLCDKYGILLLHGITMRVAEGDQSPADAVRREIIDGPRRMSSRASCAAFCVVADAAGAAETLVEALHAYCFDTPVLLLAREPFDSYLPSVPEARTLRSFAVGEEANLLSYAAESHTRGDVGELLRELAAEYRFPSGTDELAYLSQLYALDRIEEKLTAARAARLGACISDRLNDGEPLISPSLIDSFGRRKAAYYRLRRLFAPVSVLHRLDGYSIGFTVSNDRAKEYSGTITYRVLDRDNSELHHGTLDCPPLHQAGVAELPPVDLTELIKGHERDRYLVYSYSDGSRSYSDTVIFTRHKYFKYKNPHLRADVSGSGRKFDITLYAEAFTHRLRLGFRDTDATFEDNFFDITDGAPLRVRVETAETVSAEKLSSELILTSMYDIGRDI